MAIICYEGKLGAGKTFSMIYDLRQKVRERMRAKRKPIQVYSNMVGLKFPEYRYIGSAKELIDLTEGYVMLDEASTVFNSKYRSNSSQEMISRFNQARKDGLDLVYTAQRAEAVDLDLRNLCNETVHCTRKGRWIVRRSEFHGTGKSRMAFGCTFAELRPELLALYNTLEKISTKGGSLGVTERAALSTVARRYAERERAHNAATAHKRRPPALYRERLVTGFGARHQANPCMELRLRPAARAARDSLTAAGLLDDLPDGLGWSDLVRDELERRRWLALWGYGPDDAPRSCNMLNPWMHDFDPATVKARNENAQVKEKAAGLVAAAGQLAMISTAEAFDMAESVA